MNGREVKLKEPTSEVFMTLEDGTVFGTKVVRSVHPALDAEAVRVISSMPRWAPGKIGGKAVRVKYTIPVRFQMPTGTIVDPKAYRQWKKYMTRSFLFQTAPKENLTPCQEQYVK